jgi:hypothetical protein
MLGSTYVEVTGLRDLASSVLLVGESRKEIRKVGWPYRILRPMRCRIPYGKTYRMVCCPKYEDEEHERQPDGTDEASQSL